MRTEIVIRSETDADVDTIADVTSAAFSTLPISDHTEQFIIAALRAANALTVSLVAEMDGRVVGHIAFSPVTMSDGSPGWYGLGPVSVLPAYQRQGIGGALIQEGTVTAEGAGRPGMLPCGTSGVTTSVSDSRTRRDLATRAFRKTPSLPCHSMDTSPREALRSTKDSQRLANNRGWVSHGRGGKSDPSPSLTNQPSHPRARLPQRDQASPAARRPYRACSSAGVPPLLAPATYGDNVPGPLWPCFSGTCGSCWLTCLTGRAECTTSHTASGCFAATCRRMRSGQAGVRRPCSQLRRVLTLMPSSAANRVCDSL